MVANAKKQCSEQDCKTCLTAKEMGATDPTFCDGVCKNCKNCENAGDHKLHNYLCNTYCKNEYGEFTDAFCPFTCKQVVEKCSSCECPKTTVSSASEKSRDYFTYVLLEVTHFFHRM